MMPNYMGAAYSMDEVRSIVKEIKETIKEDESVYGFYKLGELERICEYLFDRVCFTDSERFTNG